MIIALATPRVASSIDDALDTVRTLIREASAQGAEVVCFPESYVPGLRGEETDFAVPGFDRADEERALGAVQQWSRDYRIATILGTEHVTDAGKQIASFVIDTTGGIQGFQTKNQLDPSEDRFYIPGNTRRMFDVNGVAFGIAICHEGWRYPETVRWAATRGAKIVFHPQLSGTEQQGRRLTAWGAIDNPYYEKAMLMRSVENTIYFASVNYALRFQQSATTLVAPSGEMQAYLPYGEEGVLVQEIRPELATGRLALRFAPSRYLEGV